MNMFKPTDAKSIDEYISMLVDERKEPIEFLHDLIQKAVPDLEPFFAYNMLGYGKFKYVNYKKETIDWPIIAMASQKNYMSIYVCALSHNTNGLYLAEEFEKDLGKVSVGKSCIRFKKLEDLDLKTLKKVLKLAAKNPGLVS